MIVLNVTYKCKPNMRQAFLERLKAEGIDTASRQDKGCIKYDYYFPTDDSIDLLLVEKWQDAEALAEHSRKPHLAKLGEFKSEYVVDTTVEKYEVSD